MKHLKIFSIVLISTLVLQNCTIPESRKQYCPEDGCLLEKRENPNERYSSEGEALKTNGEFESLETLDEFPIPPKTPSFIKEGEMPRPKKIFSSIGSENVEVRRLGEIYWIYVEALPSKSWPLIKDFFADEEFELTNDNPTLGKITAHKNQKLFLTLEHGIKNNSSEIYLLDDKDSSVELAYFEDLAAYISLNLPGYEGNSIAAQGLNLNKKARIVYVKKEIGIEFRLPFDRTWSALSRAVDKADLQVIDRNRDLKYIQIKLDAQEDGFFNSLFRRGNDNEGEADYELVFSEVEGNTILEFKKLSNSEFSVDELVDVINESLS
ncbi:MAG: outer membrane protein assembly factor BamC [Gammaproteobacteria bacterium TMED112]|nr:MAG: outer membrane protein assembly factor BamC [Gammaproteobacteria bacterium TMED112]|tara:strand:+ start:10754 stop:11722 length:969 start_codon:yes stop_codon:yes gene_type:complete